jgi:SAM-dependent methyltransferase
MFKKDIDLVRALHEKYHLQTPLLDAGGLEQPTIADYDISVAKALTVDLNLSGHQWSVKIPHPEQSDRYVQIRRPWSFIDPDYTILNPEYGDPGIEALPEKYSEAFNTVILVSVFEHVENPYVVSDALFQLLKPGGYLINSVPFIFPYHPSPEDNFRYSPLALRRIHESSGFQWLEGDFHVNYPSTMGVGDTNPNNYGAPQTIMGCYALCRRPA